MRKIILSGITSLMMAFSVGCGAAQASSVEIYSNNFDGTITYGSGVTGGLSGVTTTASVQSLPQPFSGNMLWNSSAGGATTLTLNNLPQHTSITIGFLLGILDTWDGLNPSCCGPDSMNVTLDGKSIFSTVFANYFGTSSYSFPTGTLLATNKNMAISSYADKALDMGADPLFTNIAHTGSTLTLKWFAGGPGWQAGYDESWSMDNLKVTLNGVGGSAVPEPATVALLAVGLMGLGTTLRRRRA